MPSPWDRGRGAPPLGAAGAARGHHSKEAAMHHRRLVGIDLGIISAHTVRVLAGDGSVVCRRKAVPTVASLTETEQAALQGAAPTTRLEVVLEPTGPSWLPIAVFFTSRGHTVYRVSSARAHDLRRVLSRQAKSNGIDADTLARLPLVDPAGLHPLALPSAERAALDRRVRACDRLTQQGACHKRRIKDLVRQLLPTSPLAGELGMADLAVLERFGADPHALLAAGPGRLARLIGKASGGQHGQQRATHWLAAARAGLQVYGYHPAVAFTDLAEVGGPALVATMGAAHRFAAASRFRSFPGLAPRASETGNTDRKGQPISKAGNRLLRTTWSAPPTPPAARTPSSPASTTCRWSSAARTTSARSAWSPPTWPSGPGRSWTGGCRMSSAISTAHRSPPNKPRPSSPSAGPCPRTSAAGG